MENAVLKEVSGLKTEISSFKQDVKLLTSSLTQMSVNIEKQTQMLSAHKEVYAVQVDNMLREHKELRGIALNNLADITKLKEDVNKAKGATAFAEKIWPVVWGIGGAVVSAIVMFFTLGGDR